MKTIENLPVDHYTPEQLAWLGQYLSRAEFPIPMRTFYSRVVRRPIFKNTPRLTVKLHAMIDALTGYDVVKIKGVYNVVSAGYCEVHTEQDNPFADHRTQG